MSYIKRALKYMLHFVGLEVSRIRQPDDSFAILDEFVDSYGQKFKRIKGYRHKIWPSDWETMTRSRQNPTMDTVKQLINVSDTRGRVATLKNLLEMSNCTIDGKVVLEIGCFNGASAYALAEAGALHVDAIDMPESFVLCEEMKTVNDAKEFLTQLRDGAICLFGNGSEELKRKVSFYDADIKDLNKNNVYDLIVSWDTLEHIIEPEKAFKQMYSALKPNGLACHMYHPFFSTQGGHYDTLDFPWGHVRLSNEEFIRYILTYRPNEAAVAKKRFFSSINRMTLTELQRLCVSAGFEILSLFDTGHSPLEELDSVIFAQCKALYPSLTINDLIASHVIIILRKPL